MKKVSLLFITAIFLSIVSSCTSGVSTQLNTADERAESTEEAAQIAFEKFGKEITADGAISASKLVSELETKDSLSVKVNAEVAAVCKKKGCWMMVALDSETEMRVKFKDYEFFVPLNCEGKNTIIEGWAYKEIISVETLKHYALDGGADIAEVDGITEPKIEYTFMADGVLMN
jgi:hypothetical protein